MAGITYERIKDEVRRKHGKSVKPCWIADVKERYGLTRGPAHNRKRPRANPCPDKVRPLIEDVLRQLGMIP